MTNERLSGGDASRSGRHRTRAPLLIALLVAALAPTRALAQEELFKLFPAPGPPGNYDYFGSALAFSGDRAVIGAQGDNDFGGDSGAAYIFDLSTGQRLFELHHAGAKPLDRFGSCVAIDGDYAVIGAPARDDLGYASGAAYVFDVQTGQQLHQLLASDGEELDYFGADVAVSGDLVVVGALWDDDQGDSAGAAYVFDAVTGQELRKLIPADVEAGDWFGGGIAMEGDLAVIGATQNDDLGPSTGAAYLFDARTGQELYRLDASDAAANRFFGGSPGISGDRILIGARGYYYASSFPGAAYLFDVATGQQLFQLFASDGAAGDYFGSSLSISGDRAIIGAGYYDGDRHEQGAAYLFDVTTGGELFLLTASDRVVQDRFGSAVCIGGDRALIGAPLCHGPVEDSGAAYVVALVDGLFVTPGSSFESEGNLGGPFYPELHEYTLHNLRSTALQYRVTSDQSWVSLSGDAGLIPAGGKALFGVSFGPLAGSLGLGLHSAELDFENLSTGVGDTSRQIELDVQEGLPELFHRFPLDSDPGWVCEGQWEFGLPDGEGGDELGFPDAPSGYTGANVYGYNLQGDFPNSMPEYHLTTGPTDCSGATSTRLRFWRWLNVESATYDHAYVRASNDGSSWTTIWENQDGVYDDSWIQVEYDLSAVADGQSTVYLRWTMGTSDYIYPASGWNIDDVEIWGDAPPPPGVAYCSGQPGTGTPCPCSNDNDGTFRAGCANGVFASGAYLTATGTASVTGDTLVLRTTYAEPNNSGLYFQGNSDLSPGLVWGDGLRCAGDAVKRLQVRFADASGSSNTTIPIGAAGAVNAGDTRYYQLWYRTIVDPPCGLGINDFNTSNGFRVTWQL